MNNFNDILVLCINLSGKRSMNLNQMKYWLQYTSCLFQMLKRNVFAEKKQLLNGSLNVSISVSRLIAEVDGHPKLYSATLCEVYQVKRCQGGFLNWRPTLCAATKSLWCSWNDQNQCIWLSVKVASWYFCPQTKVDVVDYYQEF